MHAMRSAATAATLDRLAHHVRAVLISTDERLARPRVPARPTPRARRTLEDALASFEHEAATLRLLPATEAGEELARYEALVTVYRDALAATSASENVS